jgi:zinc transport system substrate-binding protein
MTNNNRCFDAEAQRRRGLITATPGRRGHAENTHFSAGCVRGLCGQASALRRRRTARKQQLRNKNTSGSDVFLLSQFCFLTRWPRSGQRSRRGVCGSALRSAFFVFVVLFASVAHAQTAKPADTLKIGVTLHPYYSWTANIVGNLPGYEVRALLPGDIDAGDYQPRPQDIKRLADLDVVIVNGIGHDDFIFPMLKASGNTRATIVRVNAETPMIRALRLGSGQAGANAVNSHTFISFSNAIQQTYAIQRALARLRPQDAPALQQNAAEYARRLRTIKARAASQLADAKVTRVVTVHDGYGYLLQEFGLEVGGVVQPSHGLTPSAGELRDMVALVKREKITVVFSEATFPEPLLKVLRDEAGVSVYIISHIASGPFTADKFEREMQQNVDTMIRALVK